MVLLLRSVRSKKRRALITDLNRIVKEQLREDLDKKVKPVLIKSHELVVADWKNKPEFKSRIYITAQAIKINVFPAGDQKAKEIYGYVDQGTKPHLIKPVKAKILRFNTGYQPKTLAKPARTVPGGGKATGPEVFAKVVHHPGSEAREFSKTIARDVQPGFKATIENSFRAISRKVQE